MNIKTISIIGMTKNKLDPQWIVGFTDGEGCFNIDIHLNPRTKWGVQIQPEFIIVQNEIDQNLLYELKDQFGCGNVTVNRKDHTGTRKMWRVKSVKHCHDKIVPFFEKHKLRTKKRIEFLRFREIVRLMNDGYYLQSLDDFLKIIDKAQKLRVSPSKVKKESKVKKRIDELREQLKSQHQMGFFGDQKKE